jgi:CRISPR-associated endonuclease Cas1
MQDQLTAPHDGIVVAYGYGIKIYVNRGHLLVEYGVGRQRQTVRLNRATSKLKRLIVIGHTGFVTLEATRWIRDVGAAFVQIDTDGELITISANRGGLDSWRRRAQVLADTTGADIAIMSNLIAAKLEGQARLLQRLSDAGGTVTLRKREKLPVSEAIERLALEARATSSFEDLAATERVAARYYWKSWRTLPVQYSPWWAGRLPEHWLVAGNRSVERSTRRNPVFAPRHAISPVHALINYAYAILRTETTISIHEFGLDPGQGLMHSTRRHQGDLVSDLMEPGRPVADEIVLDLLQSRSLDRGDVYETRDGRCRIGPSLAREISHAGPRLYDAMQPHCFATVQTLVATTKGRVPSRARRVRSHDHVAF